MQLNPQQKAGAAASDYGNCLNPAPLENIPGTLSREGSSLVVGGPQTTLSVPQIPRRIETRGMLVLRQVLLMCLMREYGT